MNITKFTRTAGCLLATLASGSFALAGDIDVLVAAPSAGAGNPTVIGSVDKGDGDIVASARVFEAEMTNEIMAFQGAYVADEPGFFTGDGVLSLSLPAGSTAAVPGSTISVAKRTFDVSGASSDLFYWDGTGSVSFNPAMSTDFFVVDGAPLDGSVGANGAFDEHPDFVINDQDNDANTSAPAGIYLVSLEATLSGGFTESAPFYLVFGTENLITPAFLNITQSEFDLLTDEDIEEELEGVIDPAVDWVQANVVIPEPSAALLAVLATMGGFATRRRG